MFSVFTNLQGRPRYLPIHPPSMSFHPSAIHTVLESSSCSPLDNDALRSFSGASGMFHQSAIPSTVLDRPIMIPIFASNRPNKSVELSRTYITQRAFRISIADRARIFLWQCCCCRRLVLSCQSLLQSPYSLSLGHGTCNP
mmetsp:Transcript_13385/g.38209  ORF Transcript_13385/g.38209 Transcript_13385/m.38209 type:complete len:141 (-) Transcript_13385:344-766(-)